MHTKWSDFIYTTATYLGIPKLKILISVDLLRLGLRFDKYLEININERKLNLDDSYFSKLSKGTESHALTAGR